MGDDCTMKPRGYQMVAMLSMAQLRKLAINEHKGGWEKMPYQYLLDRLEEEVVELRACISGENIIDATNVLEEAADVANYAGMIADNVRRELARRGL